MESWLESFARANFARSGDTAHDLKTPLNVAVLNLELLRMRLRKLAGSDDEKVTNCGAWRRSSTRSFSCRLLPGTTDCRSCSTPLRSVSSRPPRPGSL